MVDVVPVPITINDDVWPIVIDPKTLFDAPLGDVAPEDTVLSTTPANTFKRTTWEAIASLLFAGYSPYVPPGDGAVPRSLPSKLAEIRSVEDYGAVGDGVTDDTVAIQKGIDAVFNAGGGELWFGPKTYHVTRSVLTDPFDSGAIMSGVGALLWRSGVYLRGHGVGATKIHCSDLASAVITSYSLQCGGISDMTVENVSNGANGSGTGILLAVAPGLLYNRNITIRNVESCNHGSYGIGCQNGDYSNNLYDGIYIHDTGADAFDHKVRSGDAPISRGVRFSNIFCERYGRRIDDSAGLDIRGPATVVNYHAREFGRTGFINWGFRFNAGISLAGGAADTREPSSYSSLTNFFIESSPENETGGVTVNDAENVTVANGTILGTTFRGFRAAHTGSGYVIGRNVSVNNVVVQGVRGGSAFICGFEGVRFINCISRGEVHEFSQKRGNLADAQTVFLASYLIATVQVYKNGVLQTGGGVHYTATDGTTVTMTAGVLITDLLEVVTPNLIGWEVTSTSPYCFAANCAAQHTTTPFSVDAAVSDTFARLGNSVGVGGIRAIEAPGTTSRLEMWGPNDNMDFRADAKGAGEIQLRANGARVAVLSNAAAGHANWATVKGSAAGAAISLGANGSDAAISLKLEPKGVGNLLTNLGAVKNFANDAAAAAGGVPVGGFYRNGSVMMIRAA